MANKRPGRPHIMGKGEAFELTELINNTKKADRDFWTAKAFHGYIREIFAVECS